MPGTQMEVLARLHLQWDPGGNDPIYWELLQQQQQRSESGRDSRHRLALERQERRHTRVPGTENRPCGVYRGERPDQVGASV